MSAAEPQPAAAPPSHEQLRLGLMSRGRRLVAAVDDDGVAAARDDLVQYCSTSLLPHLQADDHWLHEASQRAGAGLLAQALRAEGRTMTGAVDDLVAAANRCDTMSTVRVLHTLLAAHEHHEDLLRASGLMPERGPR